MLMMKKHNNNLFNSLAMEAPNSAPSSTTTSTTTSSASPPPLGINRASRPISKPINPRPKIRIIHIFAPEIIKTDAANFRELVQRLTGKPKTAGETAGKMTSPPPPPAVKEEECGYEFLGGFQDLDGYFNVHDMCELPFYPLEYAPSQYMTMHSNNVNVMEHEPQLIA